LLPLAPLSESIKKERRGSSSSSSLTEYPLPAPYTGCFYSNALGGLKCYENPKNKVTAVPANEEEICGATFQVRSVPFSKKEFSSMHALVRQACIIIGLMRCLERKDPEVNLKWMLHNSDVASELKSVTEEEEEEERTPRTFL
jgi:hypothetical protein